MRIAVMAGAMLALAACGQQGSGPALPPVKEGALAPSTQTPVPGVQQANIPDGQRQQFLDRVVQYLDMAQEQIGTGMAAAQGFEDELAAMQPGTDHRWQVDLTGGSAYRIVGACDDDCSNMDIELIDVSTGGVVASDMLPDDFPVVDFTPPANGRYIVRLLMQTCSVAPCFAGARVLSGAPAGSGGGK